MCRRAPPSSRASEISPCPIAFSAFAPKPISRASMPPRRKASQVAYHAPADAPVASLMKSSDALVIPAVGPKLAPELFEGTSLKLVQVTGAGVDRLDQAALTRLGIPVANVAGGSNSAVAEYAVTAASMLLRRFAWADAEIKAGQLRQVPRPHGGGQSGRHRGLAGGPDRLWHHRPCGGAGVRPHGREGLLLRSGDRAMPRASTRGRCRWTSCLQPPTWCRCMCRCCRTPRT